MKDIDSLYKAYGFNKDETYSNDDVSIYTLKYGMYVAAEIVSFNEKADLKKIKEDFSSAGFATVERKYHSVEEAKETLFKGFFVDASLKSTIKYKYDRFKERQLKNLPPESIYEYVSPPFELKEFDSKGEVIEEKDKEKSDDKNNIINETISRVVQKDHPYFIIMEAGAGYGKTATSYELLRKLNTNEENIVPFFTELSRNREARIFKHILQDEIDKQFPFGIKSDVVIEQIKEGRIPLIIDGFDELISKDLTYSDKDFEQVEGMLSTILDLLKKNAKIIITTRKTAIFNNEKFFNWAFSDYNNFNLLRIEINEPTVGDWLPQERIEMVERGEIPLKEIGNPILLAYLRNVPFTTLKDKIVYSDESIADNYVKFLLTREQERQGLKLKNEQQLDIFENIATFFSEYNVTADEKKLIKDIISDFNLDDLENSITQYTPSEKPSIDDLKESLSNHVFLDRKNNDFVGFVNDFILGYCIGEAILHGKFDEVNNMPQSFIEKSINSFLSQTYAKKEELWEKIFSLYKESDFTDSFYFEIDLLLKKELSSNYNEINIFQRNIKDVNFSEITHIKDSLFTDVTFKNCEFDLTAFENTSFFGCRFLNCTAKNVENRSHKERFKIIGKEIGDKDFFDQLFLRPESSNPEDPEELNEIEILGLLFNEKEDAPENKKLGTLIEKFNHFDPEEVTKKINSMNRKEFISIEREMVFITRKGSKYYKDYT